MGTENVETEAAAEPAEVADVRTDAFFEQVQILLATRPEAALSLGRSAEQRSLAAGDVLAVVRALLLQGMAHDALGQVESDAVFARALELAQIEGEPITLLRAVICQMVVDVHRGRYADALWRGQAVLGMAHALRRNDLLLRLTINIGTAMILTGEYDLAISTYGECASLLSGDSEALRQQQIRIDNNIATAWLGKARIASQTHDEPLARMDMEHARRLAEGACERSLGESNGGLRAGCLDTLVSVLLDLGEARRSLSWVERVESCSGELLPASSVPWGIAALARCRAELAQSRCDAVSVLSNLRAIEALPGPQFRSGELHAKLNLCLSDALSRVGSAAEALACHRRWLQFDAKGQSLLAREHAMAVHRTLESLRGETEEFITHDLRNPLGAALVQLDAALAEPHAPRARRWVEAAREDVRRAFETAECYLIVLRLRHLRRADLKSLDLAELADDVGERLAPPSGSDVRVHRDLQWGLGVRGDRISLLMSLQDLLRAALVCTPKGGRVHWLLEGSKASAQLTLVGAGDQWADAMFDFLHPGSNRAGERSIRAGMLAKVSQLHDARFEFGQAEPEFGSAPRLSWIFPLAEAGQQS